MRVGERGTLFPFTMGTSSPKFCAMEGEHEAQAVLNQLRTDENVPIVTSHQEVQKSHICTETGLPGGFEQVGMGVGGNDPIEPQTGLFENLTELLAGALAPAGGDDQGLEVPKPSQGWGV